MFELPILSHSTYQAFLFLVQKDSLASIQRRQVSKDQIDRLLAVDPSCRVIDSNLFYCTYKFKNRQIRVLFRGGFYSEWSRFKKLNNIIEA